MRVAVVTGGTGFLGGHLLARLLQDGWRVYALKRTTSKTPDVSSPELFWRNTGSLVELQEVFDEAAQVDAVFHLATAYGRDGDATGDVIACNLLDPANLLELALKRQVATFVYTDTCFTVDYPYLQRYTLSKKQFGQWGKILTTGSSLRFVNLELQHPFGPGDRPGKFVPWIIEKCLGNTDTIPLTSGQQRKDFIYVDDVVSACLALVNAKEIEPGYQLIQCGLGQAVTIRNFVEIVHQLCDSRAKLDFGALPYRPNEIMHSEADTRALARLGWQPRWSLQDGIAATIEQYRNGVIGAKHA